VVSLLICSDIEYTGGLSVEISTSLTIPTPLMISTAPIKFPLVLGVSLKRFSARIQIKFKPFFASITYC
jgi:hypothetical protein